MTKPAALLVTILACLLLLSGCGREPEEEQEEDTPVPHEATYAMVLKERSNPYMLNMFDGFQTAAGELGVDVIAMGPEDYTAEGQIAIIEELMAQGVDGIAVAANHIDALDEVLGRAMDMGISVISLDSSVSPTSRMVHLQQADPEQIGRVLIQAAWSMTEGEGQVVVISSTPDATNQNLWVEWMQTEIAENEEKYRNFQLLDVLYGYDSIEMTGELTRGLLEEYPDLDLIITPSVVSMLAVGQELEAARTDVRFTGLGLPSEMADYIQSGLCPWMYLWNPIDLGYLAAYTLYGLDTGEITGQVGDIFSVGSLGTRIVAEATDGGTEILLGDPIKFDADNIGEWKSVY